MNQPPEKTPDPTEDDWVMVNDRSQDPNVAVSSGTNEPSTKNEQHIVNRNMGPSMEGKKPHRTESERGGGIYFTERRGGYTSRHIVHGARFVRGKLLNGDADPASFRKFFGLEEDV